jgi:acyl-CoA synthetase (AMP-forming)/AMP-acid ligase II
MIEAIDFMTDSPALLVEGPGQVVSYRELGRRVDAVRDMLRELPRPALVFLFANNSVAGIAAYLACLAERIPLGFGEPSASARAKVIEAYAPTAVFVPAGEVDLPIDYELSGVLEGGGLELWQRLGDVPFAVKPHANLALLLATSGSTGDAKFVRLSLANLVANARSIATYLDLGPHEIAIQSLPIHYSYGLSVLNSHLLSGAAVALTSHSFMRPEFWRSADDCRCTSFAGVPYMYETLHRLRLMPTDRPALRTLTQAGGHLRVELVRHFHEGATRRNRRLFVMYGQTEATARISYVPPERLTEKAGSIGVAIPDGELWLEPVEGGGAAMRQLYYRGPNVMMGYATVPADLARGDEHAGVLATGDLGESDVDGYIRITGRLARFAKLFGKRINLAGLEGEIEKLFPVRAAALDGSDRLKIYLEGGDVDVGAKIREHLAGLLGVPPLSIKVELLAQLPLTASGKKNYRALA